MLGYSFEPSARELDDGSMLPVLGEVKKPNSAPELWILDMIDPSGEGKDPLSLHLVPCQFPKDVKVPEALMEATLDDVITRQVFGRADPPRWVLLTGSSQLVLMDRGKASALRRA